jgi:hypothetical protein
MQPNGRPTPRPHPDHRGRPAAGGAAGRAAGRADGRRRDWPVRLRASGVHAPPTPAARRQDSAYGWVVVAALAATTTVSYGVLTYAFGVLLVPMQHELGWSPTTLTGAFSVALGVSALVGLAVGRLLDRHSPRVLMTAGSAIAAVGVLAWSKVGSVAELYLVFVVLGLAMPAVLYEPAFIVITKWFTLRRHRALTTLTVLAAASSLIFSPLTQHLVAALGWRGATATLAAILAAVTVPLHALLLRPPPPAPTRPDGPGAASPPPAATATAVLRTGGFRLLAGAFMLAAFASTAMAVHLVPLLLEGGHPAGFAALAAGLVGIAQLPGRLLFALVGSRLGGPRLPVMVFGLGALALAGLALDRSGAGVVGFAVVYGMGNGMTTLLRATLPGDLYGAGRYGAITGVVAGVVNTVRATAPFAAAALALLPGRYTTVLWLLAAANTAAAVMAMAGVTRQTLRPAQPT